MPVRIISLLVSLPNELILAKLTHDGNETCGAVTMPV